MAVDIGQQETFRRILEATGPSVIEHASLEDLRQYQDFLCLILRSSSDLASVEKCKSRLPLIAREIELKRLQAQTERHHLQNIGVGRKGLNWARVAGIAGIVTVLIGTASLLLQIYSSNNQPGPTATPSPALNTHIQSPTNESPEPDVSSSISKPSPSPTVETESPAQP